MHTHTVALYCSLEDLRVLQLWEQCLITRLTPMAVGVPLPLCGSKQSNKLVTNLLIEPKQMFD